ncbi:MAG TPA: ATP-grasp domain-containing protein [Acidimicrobiia bacterium]|nr:ATP-grasp domain-containing protein [Acidimicrobiia bacterium]
MPRALLLLPTATYRAADFVAAARALGVEVVVASEEAPVLAATMGDRAVTVPLDDPDQAARVIEALDARSPIDAVVAVDDQGVVVAAQAGERLGFPHNPPDAVARTRDKAAMRDALAAAEVPQPRYARLAAPDDLPDVGWPRVVKPTRSSASRGVIRADDPAGAEAAARQAAAIAGQPLLVEEYVPGVEVAVEGLLRGGELTVLAVFDKPDAMEGPYFEETIYVTPSRLPEETLASVRRVAADAAGALGLTEGPVHAELRVHEGRVSVLEVAARSIGGLCARSLRLGAGISLEEVILRHALQLPIEDLTREPQASGVMMLPIPRSGTLVAVRGQDDARAVPGIVGLEVTIPRGRAVRALPEGDRYLGFLFARAPDPAGVEDALRRAHARLTVEIA